MSDLQEPKVVAAHFVLLPATDWWPPAVKLIVDFDSGVREPMRPRYMREPSFDPDTLVGLSRQQVIDRLAARDIACLRAAVGSPSSGLPEGGAG